MSTDTSVIDRIMALRAEILEHDRKYYVHANPTISDAEYDKLMQELILLETNHPQYRTPDSPTQRVGGAPRDGLPVFEHARPMLSINNAFKLEDVDKWIYQIQNLLPATSLLTYRLELKVDGLAVALHYINGRLERAVTRGDGKAGEDVTHNIVTVRGVPLAIDDKIPYLEVRGEIFIGKADFEVLRAEAEASGEKIPANSRNSASGALRLLDPAKCAQRRLRFVPYDVYPMKPDMYRSHHLDKLVELGFPTSPLCFGNVPLDNLNARLDTIVKRCENIDIPIDGIVIKTEEHWLNDTIGATDKFPRWALAYKWQQFASETMVNAVTLQVGRTGAITPVAELEPVEIDGTVVSRATLHNFPEIARLDLRVGDRVLVEKAGKIIPRVVSVLHEKRPENFDNPPIEEPTLCPACNGPVGRAADEVVLRCQNGECVPAILARFKQFASRGGMYIDGLGPTLIQQLYDAGLIFHPLDLYTLHTKRDSMLAIEGVGKKKVDSLLEEIEKSKQRPLASVLYALGIRGVGEGTSRDVASYCKTLDVVAQATWGNLMVIPGLGEQAAKEIETYFVDPAGQAFRDLCQSQGFACMVAPPETPTSNATPHLAGLTFVVTGTLPRRDRETIKQLIRDHDGKVSESVSKKTSYLIAGSDAGSKLQKAHDLGVRVISEDDFDRLLAGQAI